MAQVKLITNPKTKPPGDGPYVAVEVDGKERWFKLASDTDDGIVDADFDFAQGQKWVEKKAADRKGGG